MKALIMLLVLCISILSTAIADTTLPWRGEPLTLQIPVGVERVIRFEANKMQVGIPRDLAGIASAESNNGFVYLRAARQFEQKRFRFRDKETGRIYAIDVSAREGGAFQPVRIVDDMSAPSVPNPPATDITPPTDPTWSALADTNRIPAGGEDTDESAAREDTAPVNHPYTALTRYAMQQLYAPARLITPLDDLVTVNVTRETLNALVPGARISAHVLGQWRNVDHLVTAIVLHNHSDQAVHLDPRAMRGKQFWLTAALIRDWLSPVNQPGERTGLVVISQQQWTDYPWLKR